MSLQFKGTITLIGVKSNEWTNPEGKVLTFHDIVAFSNTGFEKGPKAYVYHLKLNSRIKDQIDEIKLWPKGTEISVAGLVTSVDKPGTQDPTRMWTQMGLLTSEVSLTMASQPQVVKEYQRPPQEQPVQGLAPIGANDMSQFDEVPF